MDSPASHPERADVDARRSSTGQSQSLRLPSRRTRRRRRAPSSLGISIAVAGEPLVRTGGYRWKGWDSLQWHERRKAGWPILQRAFQAYLGARAGGPAQRHG